MINSPVLNYFNANSMHCFSQNSLHYLHYFELLSNINFAIYILHNGEMRYTAKGCVSISYFHSQFPFVQLACIDCYLTKEYAKLSVKLASKGFDFISIK